MRGWRRFFSLYPLAADSVGSAREVHACLNTQTRPCLPLSSPPPFPTLPLLHFFSSPQVGCRLGRSPGKHFNLDQGQLPPHPNAASLPFKYGAGDGATTRSKKTKQNLPNVRKRKSSPCFCEYGRRAGQSTDLARPEVLRERTKRGSVVGMEGLFWSSTSTPSPRWRSFQKVACFSW